MEIAMSNCGFVSHAGFDRTVGSVVTYTTGLVVIPRHLPVQELIAFGKEHEAFMSAHDMQVLAHTNPVPECLTLGVRVLFPECLGRDAAGSEFINGFEVTGKKEWGTRNLTSHGYYTRDLSLALHPYYLLVRTPRA